MIGVSCWVRGTEQSSACPPGRPSFELCWQALPWPSFCSPLTALVADVGHPRLAALAPGHLLLAGVVPRRLPVRAGGGLHSSGGLQGGEGSALAIRATGKQEQEQMQA